MGQFLTNCLCWFVGYLQTAHILLDVQIFALRSGGLIRQSPLGLSMQKIFVLIVILAAISFSEYSNHLDPPYDERFDPSRLLTQLALDERQIDIPEAGATVTERLNAFICRDVPVDLDDYIYTRDDLDTSDLTVAGFDAGGMTAFLTAAVDGRVRNTMVSGAFCDSPVLPPGLSMTQIAQNIAPRNLWIEVGNKDGGPFVDWLSTQLLRSASQRQVQVAGKLKV